jgi:hypothetical protein
MRGRLRLGVGLGHGYVDLGGYVLALTPPGSPRMPNGVETDLEVAHGHRIEVGAGGIASGSEVVLPGPLWIPRPAWRVRFRVSPSFVPDPDRLAGRGSGLTPAGDDLLIGFVAGLRLLHDRADEAHRIATSAAQLTTALSATLLRHAALGDLPEPAHAALERADPHPLLDFGHSSGAAVLLGLALAGGDPWPGDDDVGPPTVARGWQELSVAFLGDQYRIGIVRSERDVVMSAGHRGWTRQRGPIGTVSATFGM